jgi:hypothetical protein
VSSSADGGEIARLFSQAHQQSNAKEWEGDSRDSAFGCIKVGLALSDTVPDMLAIKRLQQGDSRLNSAKLSRVSPGSQSSGEEKA